LLRAFTALLLVAGCLRFHAEIANHREFLWSGGATARRKPSPRAPSAGPVERRPLRPPGSRATSNDTRPGAAAGVTIRTEEAYVQWARRNAFLTYLAVVGNVSASTQNQALSAILFLYRNVLDSPSLDAGDRAGETTSPASGRAGP
jgi:hypothetical protein